MFKMVSVITSISLCFSFQHSLTQGQQPSILVISFASKAVGLLLSAVLEVKISIKTFYYIAKLSRLHFEEVFFYFFKSSLL